MTITLYELNESWFALQSELANTDDPELREELLKTIDSLEQSIDEKREAYCIVIKNLEATADALQSEVTRLNKKIEAIDNSIEAVKKRLRSNIPEGVKWSRGAHSIAWRGSESVKVTDDTKLPADYMRESISYTPDKTLLKEALKAGKVIEGAILETKNNMQVK